MAENSDKDRATRLLEGAYAIRTVADNIEYYRDFADIYDHDFADQMGYIYPAVLAQVVKENSRSSDGPIVDIGCGTGLVADALIRANAKQDPTAAPQEQAAEIENHNAATKDHAVASENQAAASENKTKTLAIDGIDISHEMLETARQKNLYHNLYQADLTQDFSHLPGNYGVIVSAGTFTFGHLGPSVLPVLLSLGRSDTLYCIGVNSKHFEQQGFSTTLKAMLGKKLISQPVTEVRSIYNPKTQADSNHAEDTATVLIYRQL